MDKVQIWCNTVLKQQLIRCPNTPIEDINLCTDYLRSRTDKQYQKTSYDLCLSLARKRKEELEYLHNRLSTTTILKSYPHYHLVRINTHMEFKFEGNTLGHCLGGTFYRNYLAGSVEAISLRDLKMRPRMTVLVGTKPLRIIDVRCKGNSFPTKKYAPYLMDIIISNQYGQWNVRGPSHQCLVDEFFKRMRNNFRHKGVPNNIVSRIHTPTSHTTYKNTILRGLASISNVPYVGHLVKISIATGDLSPLIS